MYIESDSNSTKEKARKDCVKLCLKNPKSHWYYYCIGILFIIVIILGVFLGISKNNNRNTLVSCDETAYPIFNYETDGITDISKYGQWQTIIPNNQSASWGAYTGMQTVHTVLLPSGKVLFASGSSWRNAYPIDLYPYVENPNGAKGLFNKFENPFEWNKSDQYYSLVNNVGIYNPVDNSFFRIPHPKPFVPDPDNSSWFLPTDLFCNGHQHVQDGNVLFIGGTQFYFPQRTGTKTTNIFNWTKELTIDWISYDWTKYNSSFDDIYYPWLYSGTLNQGRWYPQTVPLLDGRLVVIGGFIGFDNNVPDMYQFEMNRYVSIFNYQLCLQDIKIHGTDYNNYNNCWAHIDATYIKNSHYATRLPESEWPLRAFDCTNERQCQAYRNDSFKLYPHCYLLKDGRIYFTREGDWNSLRDSNASAIRRTKNTYFMSIDDYNNITFTRGPDRPDNISNSGTTVLDPNSGNINLYGGMPMLTGGTMLPSILSSDESNIYSANYGSQWAGSRGSRKFEMFEIPANINEIGQWFLKDENYLGTTLQDDRTMHYSLLLPTKQILIIGGSNYDFYGSVFLPLLLTPVYTNNKFTGSYTHTKLAPAVQPRLYHCTAILLPNGKILVSGGNAARAIIYVNESAGDYIHSYNYTTSQIKPNLDRINTRVFFKTDGTYSEGPNESPAENWIMELFSPPYIFIDIDRDLTINNMTIVNNNNNNYNVSKKNEYDNNYYYLIHSNDTYQLNINNIPNECMNSYSDSLVIIKLGSVTHGWDSGQRLYSLTFDKLSNSKLQFTCPDYKKNNIAPGFYTLWYVDCKGKVSSSLMVRFDDSAITPF